MCNLFVYSVLYDVGFGGKMAIQLDLFEPDNELFSLRKEMNLLKESNDKVRKRLFAQLNELSHLCIDLKEEVYKLRRRIGSDKVVDIIEIAKSG